MHFHLSTYRKRSGILFLGSLALLLTIVAGAMVLRPQPPKALFDQARTALERARAAEAATYAPERLAQAEQAWSQAMTSWQGENTRWFLLRDFETVGDAARQAAELALTATQEATASRDSLQHLVDTSLPSLRRSFDTLKVRLEKMPFHGARQRAFSRVSDDLARMDRAVERDQYLEAAATLDQTSETLDSLHRQVGETLKRYFSDLDTWQQWHSDAITWSKKNRDMAIVVDKMGQRCYVYQSGKLQATYAIELGPQWMGDKLYEGDMATPEGHYKVIKKLDRRESIYHRALLLNYPNDSDRKRFAEAKSKGTLPRSARIGGNIELHGHGGKGANWTRGCVALRNQDIDQIFRLAKVGTPVIIVGALERPDIIPSSHPPDSPPPANTGKQP